MKTILRSLFDERIPRKQKITTILASVYTISPINFILDVASIIGLADDGFVLTSVLIILRYSIPKEVYKEHQKGYMEDPGIGMAKILTVLLVLWIGLLAVLGWAILGN